MLWNVWSEEHLHGSLQVKYPARDRVVKINVKGDTKYVRDSFSKTSVVFMVA
jgi:hypothetical protein